LGCFVDAREVIERATELFSTSQETDKVAARAVGQDAGVAILAFMSWVLWMLGDVDTAVVRMAAALERADELRDAHTQAFAWYYASVLHALRGEPVIAQGYAERCLDMSEQRGFRQWLRLSSAIRGVCGVTLEASASRLDEVAAALDDYQQAGYQLGTTGQFALVASALILCKEPEAALERIDRGLSNVTRSDERYFEAELYRLKARALLMRGAMDAEVESLLDRALQTARSQQAKSFELRAAADLAKVWMHQDKPAEALDLLGPVYARFTEGFNTPDMKNAKALFTELSEVTTSQANNST